MGKPIKNLISAVSCGEVNDCEQADKNAVSAEIVMMRPIKVRPIKM